MAKREADSKATLRLSVAVGLKHRVLQGCQGRKSLLLVTKPPSYSPLSTASTRRGIVSKCASLVYVLWPGVPGLGSGCLFPWVWLWPRPTRPALAWLHRQPCLVLAGFSGTPQSCVSFVYSPPFP